MVAGAGTHERPYRVAVVRALPGLGDFLCAVPALRALRHSLPFARNDLIWLSSTRPLAHRFRSYVNHLVEFPGDPGIPEVPSDSRRLLAFLSEVRRVPYDLVIQMHGDGTYMNGFSLALGSPLVFGFHPPDSAPPHAERFLPYVSDESEVRRNLRLVQHAGARLCGEHLEFPLSPLDAAEIARIPEAARLRPGRYAVVHPGASSGEKRWGTEHFACVADRLAAEGITPVLTGVISEAGLTAAVLDGMDLPAVDLTGRTSLGALAMLISGAALVVANDTGVSHLADALAVPSVIVFSGSDPRRWAPLDSAFHRVIDLTARGRHEPMWTEMLACCAGGDARRDVPTAHRLPLSGVLAEVEHLLAIGGGGVS